MPLIPILVSGNVGNIRTAMHRGAYDFLTKPIDFEDLEAIIARTIEHVQQYLRHVAWLTDAAEAFEKGDFDPNSLDIVSQSGGGLGRLARVFQHMVREVQAREQQLQQQMQELRTEIDQPKKSHQVPEVTESDYFRRLQQVKAANIKSIASLKQFVEKGALIGVAPDYHALGKAVASIVDRHQKGEPLAQIEVQPDRNPAVVINQTTARALHVKIPETLLKEAILVK